MPHNYGRWTPREAAYLESVADEQAQERGQLFDTKRFTKKQVPAEQSLLGRLLQEVDVVCDEPYERRYDPATNPDANFHEIIHIQNLFRRLDGIMGTAVSVAIENGHFGLQQQRGEI